MKKWQDYKKTFRTEPDLFDFSRTGDLRGLADTLTASPETDLNSQNTRGYSPLMLAVYNGQKDFCEALLRCGANVNSTDSVGNTVLMASAFKGDLNILKLLLEFGATTELKNQSNMTVRDWAVMFGRGEVLAYLDHHYPTENNTSKIKSFFRFIKLSFILLKTKFKQSYS